MLEKSLQPEELRNKCADLIHEGKGQYEKPRCHPQFCVMLIVTLTDHAVLKAGRGYPWTKGQERIGWLEDDQQDGTLKLDFLGWCRLMHQASMWKSQTHCFSHSIISQSSEKRGSQFELFIRNFTQWLSIHSVVFKTGIKRTDLENPVYCNFIKKEKKSQMLQFYVEFPWGSTGISDAKFVSSSDLAAPHS